MIRIGLDIILITITNKHIQNSYFIIHTIHFLNPLVTNGISHPYFLDESTFILGDFRSDFSFFFIFR